MSDGESDVGRDLDRSEAYREIYDPLLAYVLKPTKKNYATLRKAAEKVDSIGRGYWGERTSITKQLDGVLERLAQNDRDIWERLLSMFKFHKNYRTLFQKSPFAH